MPKPGRHGAYVDARRDELAPSEVTKVVQSHPFDALSFAQPRESTRRAALQAATEILERDGFQAATMEAIAEQAGVSKVTLYRWWPEVLPGLFYQQLANHALEEGLQLSGEPPACWLR